MTFKMIDEKGHSDAAAPVLLRDFINKVTRVLQQSLMEEISLFSDIGIQHKISPNSFYLSAAATSIQNGMDMIMGLIISDRVKGNDLYQQQLLTYLDEVVNQVERLKTEVKKG